MGQANKGPETIIKNIQPKKKRSHSEEPRERQQTRDKEGIVTHAPVDLLPYGTPLDLRC